MDYENKIREVGEYLINEYEENNGKIYCGINGPYDDSETRVRNLCHLIIITSVEYKITNEEKKLLLLKKMALDLEKERKNKKIYTLRKKIGKDECNGVIGHSWVIEAYVYLYKVFTDYNYIIIAKQIAEEHKFNQKNKLWEIPMPDKKSNISIDYTYNHQLWFAASLLELNVYAKDPKIENELNLFFENLKKISTNSFNGKISHSIYKRVNLKENVKQQIKKFNNLINEAFGKESMKYKEEGYHLFNIMAFARIYEINPKLEIFNSVFFKKAIRYLNSDKFINGLEDSDYLLDKSLKNDNIKDNEKKINVYGYPYNVPGFEIQYIYNVFKDNYIINKKIIDELENRQYEYTYSKDSCLFNNNCHDSWTINYRIYEYYKYLEKKYEEIK